jgi:hypothetical protein
MAKGRGGPQVTCMDGREPKVGRPLVVVGGDFLAWLLPREAEYRLLYMQGAGRGFHFMGCLSGHNIPVLPVSPRLTHWQGRSSTHRLALCLFSSIHGIH